MSLVCPVCRADTRVVHTLPESQRDRRLRERRRRRRCEYGHEFRSVEHLAPKDAAR